MGGRARHFRPRPKPQQNDTQVVVVGDNGIGHTMLTAGASLLPGIRGYATPTAEQERYIKLVSPQRETLKR